MLRSALRRFMYGRYGNDQLNTCMMGAYLALLILSALSGWRIANHLSLVLAVLILFRMLSRNYAARRRENQKFQQLTAPLVRRSRLWRTILRDKEHRYFKCQNCGQYLRVPKGKGKITVTCRGCGASFNERS